MFRFKIFYVPGDREAAEALGAELTARGHHAAVHGDPQAADATHFATLSDCDCVIVIWTAGSVSNEGVCAVAREAHRLGLLLPIRVDSLSTDQLPSEFRTLNTLVIDDVDDIDRAAGLIKYLSSRSHFTSDDIGSSPEAPEIGAAEGPPRLSPEDRFDGGLGPRGGTGAAPGLLRGRTGAAPMPSAERIGASTLASPQENALAIEAGQLVHKIPDKMWLGQPDLVEVRLGREATADLASGLLGRGALTTQNLSIVETMAVSLYSESGAFEIESQTEAVQLILSDHLNHTPFKQAEYGRWLWLVTPRKTGAHQLFVRVSASIKDSRGLPTSITLPDREFKVSVSVHAGRATLQVLKRGIPAVGGVICAAILGAITQDFWWPMLKGLIQSWGWIG